MFEIIAVWNRAKGESRPEVLFDVQDFRDFYVFIQRQGMVKKIRNQLINAIIKVCR